MRDLLLELAHPRPCVGETADEEDRESQERERASVHAYPIDATRIRPENNMAGSSGSSSGYGRRFADEVGMTLQHSPAALIQALALVSRLEALVRTSEESRDLQRRTLGRVLPKTDAKLVQLRRELAAANLEASRVARDAGLDEIAHVLVRAYAAQEHLALAQGERLAAAA